MFAMIDATAPRHLTVTLVSPTGEEHRCVLRGPPRPSRRLACSADG